MARYRARHDYGYLRDVSPTRAFEEAYRTLPYGNRREWPHTVHRLLLDAFEGHEALCAHEAVEAIIAASKTPASKGLSDAFKASRAGNALGWGMKLGCLTESVEDGRTVWRMPDREPWFELDRRGYARQVRGLTGAQQADLNRKRAAQKARANIRAKAAEANRPRVEAALAGILLHDPDFTIPTGGSWPHDRWYPHLPTLAMPDPVTPPTPLVEVLPIVREAHEAMEPRDQERWLIVIERAAYRAKCEAQQRQRAAQRAVEDAARAAIEAADDAALEGL
jgi:hypothetical protein